MTAWFGVIFFWSVTSYRVPLTNDENDEVHMMQRRFSSIGTKDGRTFNNDLNDWQLCNSKVVSNLGGVGGVDVDEEGLETLGMLILAFERKMTFIVGTSLTTGRSNTVCWSGIHHKT